MILGDQLSNVHILFWTIWDVLWILNHQKSKTFDKLLEITQPD